MVRTIGGLVCGALVAALGALILGEYEFTGTLPYIAGPLFGLAVGETVVAVGQARTMVVAGIASLLSLGGITWAGWIDSSEGVEPLHTGVWVAAALAAMAAFLRTAELRPDRR